MPEIRSKRDLRDTSAISQLRHTTAKPVFVTKNGRQDLVIMSNEEFERRCTREEVYAKLLEAKGDMTRGDLLEGDEVFRAMRAKYAY